MILTWVFWKFIGYHQDAKLEAKAIENNRSSVETVGLLLSGLWCDVTKRCFVATGEPFPELSAQLPRVVYGTTV